MAKKRRLTPIERLTKIAAILEDRDRWLLAGDGPVTQQPSYLREIYLLAIDRAKEKP